MTTALISLACVGATAGAAASSPYFSTSSWLSLYSVLVADDGVRVERDLAYGDNPRNRLDIYRPRDDRGGPVVVFFYGGSWRFGEKETYGFVGAALAARGITAIIPNYRLYPEVRFPEFVRDAALAYRWVSDNVAKDRPIILFGHSAGAHIAAMLAADRSYLDLAGLDLPRPAAFIGLAGPYAFDPTEWKSTKHVFATVAETPDAARPIAFAGPRVPPTLLIHGTDDDVVRLSNTRDFAKALKTAGVDVREVEPDIGHIGILLALSRPFRRRAPVLDEVVRFVKETPRPTPQPPTVTGRR